MNTPLYKGLNNYLKKGRARFFMPGHKGKLPYPLESCAYFDVTEVGETGCLYDGEGPMIKTEEQFAKFYKSGGTLLSTGGSTLCIQAMLALFCKSGDKVLFSRNAHHSAVNAAALLGLRVCWLLPDVITGKQTTGQLSDSLIAAALEENPDAVAVYITSPDYFGSMANVSAIEKIVHQKGKKLLVDNAHGAHLAFFKGLHPISQGADACCDSLHKTLPALTGGALLHLKNGELKNAARRKMATFGSTSPSYLIMLSCDMILENLSQMEEDFKILANQVDSLYSLASQKGVWATSRTTPFDPVRITLAFDDKKTAIELLQQENIEAEYISTKHIVLLPAPNMDLTCVSRLIEKLPPVSCGNSLPTVCLGDKLLDLREAVLACGEEIPLANAFGRIAAAPIAPCPPGAAVIMPGEAFNKGVIELLTAMGTASVWVIDEKEVR